VQSLTVREWGKSCENVVWIDEVPWQMRDRILSPLSFPHITIPINRQKIRQALRSNRGLVARWSDDWDRGESAWWWTCCADKSYDLPNIPSHNSRRNIRKGLRYCQVQKIVEEDRFISESYPIYRRAMISYGISSAKVSSFDNYSLTIRRQGMYKGMERWGAFFEGKLVAFANCITADQAVVIGVSKSDPDYHKYCPNNALYFSLTKHYLSQGHITYVTNGARTLLHDTTINWFLIRLGFQRSYCRLNIELSDIAKAVELSKVGLWGKWIGMQYWSPIRWKQLNGFAHLVKIADSFKAKHR